MSIWDIHYDALYGSPIAVDAVLTVACGDVPHGLRVIDKTDGSETVFNGVEMVTIGPAARVRARELAEKGIDTEALRDAVLNLNGRDWLVKANGPLPAPTGAAHGEIRLILEASE
ncbi:hypothetical protein P9279_22120 [Mesorhizobium sp. WSM4962]|uniref:hypothetical protein n=1 Tax=Mesorhizobium sp. WSM4962 TaxID=3038548 RepID=UPI002417830A|nr:hypothetical protein [Mesorhizobium sp. WSM4962]MDG4903210.1 hypothetical protein [Mesorhizobium sp. WSM4962]